MAASLPYPTILSSVSPGGPSSLNSQFRSHTKANFNGITRTPKTTRFAAPSRSKRTGRPQRDCGSSQADGVNSCKTRCASFDRVESEKGSTCVEVPSGSVDSTTVPRRKIGGPGTHLISEHSNSQLHSTAKTPRYFKMCTSMQGEKIETEKVFMFVQS